MIWSKPLLYYLLGQSSLSTNVSRLYPTEELQNVSRKISIPEFSLPEVDLLRHKTDNKQSTPDAFAAIKLQNARQHNRPNFQVSLHRTKRGNKDEASSQEEPTVVPTTSLGCESLAEIRANGAIYVDRTEMAYNIITDEYRRISIFMRPRRFGKTLLLNVFETILRHNEEDLKLLRGTYVENLAQQLPTYTVLRFNLQDQREIEDFETRLNAVAESYGCLERFLRLKEVAFIQRKNQQQIEGRTENNTKTILFFPDLISLLKKPVAVLVDEYNIVFDTTDNRTRDYFFRFFQSLKDLKATGQLGFAFITGCDKVKMNIKGYSSNHGLGTTLGIEDISGKTEFAHLLGFTEKEIKTYYHVLAQLKAENCSRPVKEIYDQMEFQYDGYQFGDNHSPRVYNPVSIMKYLMEKENFQGDNYWIETVPDACAVIESLLQNRVDLNQELLDLHSHYTAGQLFDEEVHFPSPTSKGNDGGVEALLFRHGYLTTFKKEGKERTLKFPNNEVVGAFERMFINALAKSKEGHELAKIAWESLENLDMKQFAESFNEFIQNPAYQEMISLIECELETLHKNFLTVMMRQEQCRHCRVYRETSLRNKEDKRKKKRPDFIFDTENKRIYVEFKYESLEAEFKAENFEQFKGYKFYACEHHHSKGENVERAKILVNLDREGIALWYGPIKYKFMTEEEEDRASEAEIFNEKFLDKSIRDFPKFECTKCNPPLPLSDKYKYEDHMSKNIHRPCHKCGKPFSTIQSVANHLKSCLLKP